MILAVLATWADLISFLGMVALRGPAAEGNPVVRLVLEAGGLPLVIVLKVALIVALVLWSRAVGRWTWLVALVGLVAGVTGAVSNVWTAAL